MQRRQYNRFFTEYALYDRAPTGVLAFWFANKPAAVPRSALHFNVLLHGCTVDGDVARAQRLLGRMATEGVAPDETSYQFLMATLCRAGKVADAVAQFDVMTRAGLLPAVAHYNLLITALADAKDATGAEVWVARLKKDKDVGPSVTAASALLQCYQAPGAKAVPAVRGISARG